MVLILRMAAIDAEISRLLGSLQEIAHLLDQQRADLGAFGDLIAADRARIGTEKDGSPRIAKARRKQLRRDERTCSELAEALERDQAETLALSVVLQRLTGELGAQRRAVAGRVSARLLGQYEAAVRAGRVPAIVAARDGACSSCAAPLAPDARWLVREGGQIVPCSGCARLLHDPVWVQRDFMPSTLRPLPKAHP